MVTYTHTCLAALVGLLLISGCGDKPAEAPHTTPPPPPPPAAPTGGIDGAATQQGIAAGAAPIVDAAAEAKKAAEEDTKLKARLTAGEEGTTPDPVGDKNLWALQAAYDSFYNAYRRDPKDLLEMVRAGYLRSVPQPPAGKQYVILPEGGGIQVSDKK